MNIDGWIYICAWHIFLFALTGYFKQTNAEKTLFTILTVFWLFFVSILLMYFGETEHLINTIIVAIGILILIFMMCNRSRNEWPPRVLPIILVFVLFLTSCIVEIKLVLYDFLSPLELAVFPFLLWGGIMVGKFAGLGETSGR